MSCAKRYLRKRRKVILTLMPFTHRACFLCHTWSHYSHTWRSCTAGGEKKKKKVEVPTPCVTSSPVFLLGLTHVLAWSIRTNLELLAFKRSLWSQIVVTCSVVEVGNDDDYNFKADNIQSNLLWAHILDISASALACQSDGDNTRGFELAGN